MIRVRWLSRDAAVAASPQDPGSSNLIATGSGQGDALPLTGSANAFSTVPPGAGARLPAANSNSIAVYNQGQNILSIYPSSGDQIGPNGVNKPVMISPGNSVTFETLDTPLTPPPRTWYQEGAGVVEISGSGPTGARPGFPVLSEQFFDTSLGLPIWWNGAAWVNATGAPA